MDKIIIPQIIVMLNKVIDECVQQLQKQPSSTETIKQIKEFQYLLNTSAKEQEGIAIPYVLTLLNKLLSDIKKSNITSTKNSLIRLLQIADTTSKLLQTKQALPQQYFQNIKICLGKEVRLTVVYGSTETAQARDPLRDIAEYAVEKKKRISQIITALNQKIQNSVILAFDNRVLERSLGTSFTKNLIIYILCPNYPANAFTGTITLKIKRGQPQKQIETVPTTEDIRMGIHVQYLISETQKSLALTILHETIHVIDEHSLKRLLKEKDTQIKKIRDEGIAVFAEIIQNPDSLNKCISLEFITNIRKKPINNYQFLINNLEKKNMYVYSLGLMIMLKLFLSIAKQEDAILDFKRIKKILKEKQQSAITLLNITKMMNHKTFFKYYQQKDKTPIFSVELLQEIICEQNT